MHDASRKGFTRVIPVFFVSIAIVFILTACGGGGGGGTSSSNNNSGSGGNGGTGGGGTTTPQVFCNTPVAAGNQMPVCFVTYSEDNSLYVNDPYVTVFIANASGVPMPFNLLLDTGATGVLINQNALLAAGVNLPQTSENFCGAFGDGSVFGGYISNASVATMASGGLFTTSGFPVAVNQDTNPASTYRCSGFSSGYAGFPSNGFLQGDFGMGLSPSYTFGSNPNNYSTPSVPADMAGYTNGFMLNFSPITSTDGYSYSGNGTITYGLDTSDGNNGTTGYSFFPNSKLQQQAFPSMNAEFGGVITDPSVNQDYLALFDTGSTFLYMGDTAMSNATGRTIDSSNYEYDAGLFGTGTAIVEGGLVMAMGLYNGTGSLSNLSNYDQGAGFTTSPDDKSILYQFPAGLFNNTPPNNGYILFKNTILDIGPMYGLEDMGMPYFFNWNIYWAAQSSANGWGVGMKFQ